jgi:hypothetical protein
MEVWVLLSTPLVIRRAETAVKQTAGSVTAVVRLTIVETTRFWRIVSLLICFAETRTVSGRSSRFVVAIAS